MVWKLFGGVTAFTLGVLIWPTIYRYDHCEVGGINGSLTTLVRINRITGETASYQRGQGWIIDRPHEEAAAPVVKAETIPPPPPGYTLDPPLNTRTSLALHP